MNIINPEIFINDVISSISYWDDIGMLKYTTKHKEFHFNIRAIEIDFISGKTLSIDHREMTGFHFTDQPLEIDDWDESAIKIDMSNQPLFKKLINQKVTNIQTWLCDRLWESKTESNYYQQDLTINTENHGYLLCSSAEAEEKEPEIYLIDSDELVVVTDKDISKKLQLEQYATKNEQRYKKQQV